MVQDCSLATSIKADKNLSQDTSAESFLEVLMLAKVSNGKRDLPTLAWDRRDEVVADVFVVAVAVVGLSVHHLQQVGILGQEVLELIKGVVSVVGRSHPESFDAGGFDRDGKIETL